MLKQKRTQQGNVERCEPFRLVAKGFTQRKGIDYGEVFTSVVKHATVRAMLAFAAVKVYDIEQIDVKTAFLNGPLHKEIYIEVLQAFVFAKGNVLMLKKALYGLTRPAQTCHQELNRVLQSNGFEVSCANSSRFVFEKNGSRTYMLINADDDLILGHKTQRRSCKYLRGSLTIESSVRRHTFSQWRFSETDLKKIWGKSSQIRWDDSAEDWHD